MTRNEPRRFWRAFWWYFCYLPGGQFIYYHFGWKLLRKQHQDPSARTA